MNLKKEKPILNAIKIKKIKKKYKTKIPQFYLF